MVFESNHSRSLTPSFLEISSPGRRLHKRVVFSRTPRSTFQGHTGGGLMRPGSSFPFELSSPCLVEPVPP